MQERDAILNAVREFLVELPEFYDFPTGGETPIPLPCEATLQRALCDHTPNEPADCKRIASEVTLPHAYDLTIFVNRMAVLAARTGDRAVLLSALSCLAMAGDIVDWRDMLGALSIVEDCAKRIGVDLTATFSDIARFGSEDFFHTLHGWVDKAPGWKSVKVMGFMAIETPAGLQFVDRPF